ncbi:MAG: GntR family transcriptional regulator [bacterium]|nr:GntR family transcriptional regulator [bacterium]
MAVADNEMSLHLRIRDQIQEGIVTGRIRPDENGILPSQTWFAEEMGVGITTISRAVKELEKTGLVESRKRKGLILKDIPFNNSSFVRNAADMLHFGVAFQGFANISHTRNPRLIAGIESYAREANVALHMSSFPGFDSEMDIVEDLQFNTYEKHKVDGMLLLSSVSLSSYVRLQSNGIPFVMFGFSPDLQTVCHCPDAVTSMFLVMKSLLARGCRKIALFVGNYGTLDAYGNIAVYRNELGRYDIGFDPEYISDERYDSDAAIAFVQNLLDAGKQIDAIVGYDDILAAKIAKHLSSTGRSDIIIGGFGNYEDYADYVQVTIDYRYADIGYSAAKMLADMARGIKPERTKHYYDVELIERYK